jgi:hypothetical protein
MERTRGREGGGKREREGGVGKESEKEGERENAL